VMHYTVPPHQKRARVPNYRQHASTMRRLQYIQDNTQKYLKLFARHISIMDEDSLSIGRDNAVQST
jgi:hypothetical protein